MLIAQLANFHGPSSGGLRTTVDALGRGYRRSGVSTLLVIPGRSDGEERTPTGRVVTVASPRLPGSGGYRVIVDRRAVAAVLDETRPDRIEVSDKATLSGFARWAAARGVPSVLLSHERLDAILAPRLPGPVPLSRLTDARTRRLARDFGTVVCASAFARAEFDRVGATNVVTVPLGVDLDVFSPPAPRSGDDDGELVLVTVGRLSKEKQPEVAIATLDVLRREGVPARLVMVGGGPMTDRLRRAAAHLPVSFAGHVADRRELVAILGAATVALQPCAIESFGLAVLEAMACGTPAVVPAAGAAAELVRDTGGMVCGADPESLAAGILALTQVPEPVRRGGARRRAERYPWSRTVDRMLQVHRGRVVDMVDAT